MAKNTTPMDWEFKALSPFDYQIILGVIVKGKLMHRVFRLAKLKLSKDYKLKGNVNDINEFEVPKRYINIVKLQLEKYFKMVEAEVKKDNIIVISSNVKQIKYKKLKKDWQVIMVAEGKYADKR